MVMRWRRISAGMAQSSRSRAISARTSSRRIAAFVGEFVRVGESAGADFEFVHHWGGRRGFEREELPLGAKLWLPGRAGHGVAAARRHPLHAKQSFARNGVPKQSLGTRTLIDPSRTKKTRPRVRSLMRGFWMGRYAPEDFRTPSKVVSCRSSKRIPDILFAHKEGC